MKKLIVTFLTIILLASPAAANEAEVIETMLKDQAKAWSKGDLEGFMEAYWKSDKLRFTSGGGVTKGWRATMKRYRATYGSGAEMGKLTFRDLEVQFLTDTHAVAFGRYKLDMKDSDQKGYFTLLLEKFPEGWRIIADHTSAQYLPIAVLSE